MLPRLGLKLVKQTEVATDDMEHVPLAFETARQDKNALSRCRSDSLENRIPLGRLKIIRSSENEVRHAVATRGARAIIPPAHLGRPIAAGVNG